MSLPPVLRAALEQACGPNAVFDDPAHRRVYEADAYAFDVSAPDAVVLPRTPEQAREVVRVCRRHRVPWAPRGSGTGLSGGCLTQGGGVQIGLSRLRRIVDVDPLARTAVVEAGVINAELGEELAPHGLGFAPDPSSQSACTIGGNFAENAGGPHTLKYGVTLGHVLGARIVTPEGKWLELGGAHAPGAGPDLLALQCGAEGTLGLAVEFILRLTPLPPAVRTFLAVFDRIESAAETVSRLVAAGIVPAAMELIDQVMLRAVEAAFRFGFPLDAGAVLILEVDGHASTVAHESERLRAICEAVGVRELREARDAAERQKLWRARKHAFGAVGRLAPAYATQDAVVPRAKIPAIVAHIGEVARHRRLTIGTVIHAGDGNLHPAVLYDPRDDDEVRRALLAAGDILEKCISWEGSPTGEHGVGLEKREFLPLLFGPAELERMVALRAKLDPTSLCNPSKVLPAGAGCGESRQPALGGKP